MYSIIIGAHLNIHRIKAYDHIYADQENTPVSLPEESAKKTSPQVYENHDQLDRICEELQQNNISLAPRSSITETIIETALMVALQAISYYYASKTFMTDSWHSFKETIIRK